MRTVYVIHDLQDRALVEDVVIRPLPVLGIDHWVSSQDAGGFQQEDAVIAVVSEAGAQSAHVQDEIARVVEGKGTLIPVRIDATDPAKVSTSIAALPWVALKAPGGIPDLDQLRRDLGDLLPPIPDPSTGGDVFVEAVPADYRDRTGFDAMFLGEGLEVPLPQVADAADVLAFAVDGVDETVLRYRHFSVVMSRSRRMCRFSAVNIDGRESKKKKRVGWRIDPRIPRQAQIRDECYGDPPKFSRGHMTRREDPVWGTDPEAVTGNADSMHVTNAVPQMQPFNAGVWRARGSRVSSWMGLERKPALRDAAANTVCYGRRRPEETTLYRVVQEHLETFLAQVEAGGAASLPQFVKDEFHAFLECGILAHGFLRLRCAGCGHEKLVAFSCKRRGICPSCGARRMAESAAHLVDQVIPRVPVRQWVLSFPIPLRSLFAAHPELLTPVLRVVHRLITRFLLKQDQTKGTHTFSHNTRREPARARSS